MPIFVTHETPKPLAVPGMPELVRSECANTVSTKLRELAAHVSVLQACAVCCHDLPRLAPSHHTAITPPFRLNLLGPNHALTVHLPCTYRVHLVWLRHT